MVSEPLLVGFCSVAWCTILLKYALLWIAIEQIMDIGQQFHLKDFFSVPSGIDVTFNLSKMQNAMLWHASSYNDILRMLHRGGGAFRQQVFMGSTTNKHYSITTKMEILVSSLQITLTNPDVLKPNLHDSASASGFRYGFFRGVLNHNPFLHNTPQTVRWEICTLAVFKMLLISF